MAKWNTWAYTIQLEALDYIAIAPPAKRIGRLEFTERDFDAKLTFSQARIEMPASASAPIIFAEPRIELPERVFTNPMIFGEGADDR
jgi:hypothetical protein